MTTYQTFEYDALGNVTHFLDAADAGTDDNIESFIQYHNDAAHYIVGKANRIIVGSNGTTQRRRDAVIETGTGNLTQVRMLLGNGAEAVHDMAYDQYGNITSQTGPPNRNGQRYALSYAYDPQVHTYAERVEDSFGYVSSASYDPRWGEMTNSTDINAQSITYRHDSLGRVTGITGPYQQGAGRETLQFEYHPEAAVPWALTRHFDNYQQTGDPIETVMFIDGLKRDLQTKKDGEVSIGGGNTRDVMIVSGRVIFDFVGRAAEQYYPITENLGNQGNFNPAFDGIQPTRTAHDVLDRVLSTTIPDNTSTAFSYGFGQDRNGATRFKTVVTDANQNSKVTFKDVRELITSIQEFNAGQAIWTSYEYDAMKQIRQVIDNRGNTTIASYDLGGRRTDLNSPDMGLTRYVFDPASNVIQKVTANLLAEGKAIEYDYTYNRLDGIRYPDFTENNVAYTYGPPGAAHNRANRIVTVADESGMEERFYGPLGETVKTIKTVSSETQGNAANSPEIYITEYTYDTYNRLRQLVYPDNEVLTYLYNSGGLAESVSGRKGTYDYPYMQALTYDKFEQRVYMRQGNGIETNHTYNPLNRRLATLKAGGNGRGFMDLKYTYDLVGNILGLENLAKVTSPNQFGGETKYTYQYDDLYRLTDSTGSLKQQPNTEHRYTLAMRYDDIHNITAKTQQHVRVTPSGQAIEQHKTTYDFAYAYGSRRPHAPTHIGDRTFHYDANGNQTGWDADNNGTRRTIVWDEENRIREIRDNGHTMTYKYNDAGERVFKTGPQGETVYVNQFYSVRNREVGSKHVFVGMKRVATKMVKGQENVTTPGSTTSPGNSGNTGNTPGNSTTSPHPPGNAYGLDNEHPDNTPNPPGHAYGLDNGNPNNAPNPQGNAYGLNGGNNGNTGDTPTGNNGGGSGGGAPGKGQIVYEKDIYYYHPDHLGSSTFISDADGELYQHLENFPFGETWVEESTNTQRTPYHFTAKELDEETGLYYFGARYYDPRTSVWQSCDPILNSYLNDNTGGVFQSSNLSLFAYSHLNPINYFDPDGNRPISIEGYKKWLLDGVMSTIKTKGFTGECANKLIAYFVLAHFEMNKVGLDSTTGGFQKARKNTSIEGIKFETVQTFTNIRNAHFKMNFNEDAFSIEFRPGFNDTLTVTGGTEPGHSSGMYSHGNGYKLDMSSTKAVNDYITAFGKKGYYNNKGYYSDKSQKDYRLGYRLPGINGTFFDERNIPGIGPHWDFQVDPKIPVPQPKPDIKAD